MGGESEPESNSPAPDGLVQKVTRAINAAAGTEKLEGFSLGEMFSDVFKHRSVDEMEEYLIVGTKRTTPPISEVSTGWPKPWLFGRCLLILGLTYLGFVVAFEKFGTTDLIPGLMMVGAFAAPLSTVVLFFELNIPRNVSLYPLIVLMTFGAITSLFFALLLNAYGHLGWLGAVSAGVIEEPAKLAALILFARNPKHKYILNGLLFGAAVGAGFGAFESAGYAFRAGMEDGNDAMLHSLGFRGLLAPSMHAAWTAIVGGALWRAKGANPVIWDSLLTSGFWRVLLLVVAIHTCWNIPFEPPFFIKEILLGSLIWFIVGGFVQQGLKQVRTEQQAMLPLNSPIPLETVTNKIESTPGEV